MPNCLPLSAKRRLSHLSSSSVTSASLRPTRRTPGWWDLWWRPGTGATGTMRRDSRRSAPSSSRATRRARRCERRNLLSEREEERPNTHTHTYWAALLVCLSLNPQICYTISLAKDITEAKKVPSHLTQCLDCYVEKCRQDYQWKLLLRSNNCFAAAPRRLTWQRLPQPHWLSRVKIVRLARLVCWSATDLFRSVTLLLLSFETAGRSHMESQESQN